jgi:IS30 family transposase
VSAGYRQCGFCTEQTGAPIASAAAPLIDLGSGQGDGDHKNFTIATDVQVYFCDPRSPWQRGSNENTNGLLRQYFPKGTDLSGYSQSYLNKIALRLNQRPRKTLGFETPADRLRAVLQ